jgi:hypothetical protein
MKAVSGLVTETPSRYADVSPREQLPRMVRCNMGTYDTAQICMNGHVVTDTFRRSPEFRQSFCHECGQPTIHACPHCKTEIRGDYHAPGVLAIGFERKPAPAFCFSCGKPFPWTVHKIEAAKAMADELSELSDADRVMLKASIDQIAADTPMTEVGVTRFKKLLPKMAKESADAMRRLVIDVAGKTAAELLKGKL